jgi:hypothetical protein
MTDNVIEFGKKPKQATPPAPVHGDMTGYQTARAISRHLGIAISNEDAVRLHNHIQSIAANAYTNGILNEREACAQEFDKRNNGIGFYEPHEPAEIIRARGVNA